MNDDEGEGVAIANLIGADGFTIVGWVYRWSTGAFAVMWGIDGPQRVSGSRPTLTAEQRSAIDFAGLKEIRSGDSGYG